MQNNKTSWWFQIFFIFTPTWGWFPIWLIFFKLVETTNLKNSTCFSRTTPSILKKTRAQIFTAIKDFRQRDVWEKIHRSWGLPKTSGFTVGKSPSLWYFQGPLWTFRFPLWTSVLGQDTLHVNYQSIWKTRPQICSQPIHMEVPNQKTWGENLLKVQPIMTGHASDEAFNLQEMRMKNKMEGWINL